MADKLRVQYPDAQIQIDLRGTDPTPTTPADAMTQVMCGRLPLTLRISARYLQPRELVSPATSCAQLAVHPLGEQVERVLNYSYTQLTPDQQTYWRMLAVFPAPFDANAAAAILQLDPDTALTYLGDFLAMSLLEYDLSPDPPFLSVRDSRSPEKRGEGGGAGRFHFPFP